MATQSRHWFRRKDLGWGWTPVSWQGWAITIAAVGTFTALMLRFFKP